MAITMDVRVGGPCTQDMHMNVLGAAMNLGIVTNIRPDCMSISFDLHSGLELAEIEVALRHCCSKQSKVPLIVKFTEPQDLGEVAHAGENDLLATG